MNVEKGVKGFLAVSLADRFWVKVEKTDSCWLWTGAPDGRYGIAWQDGRQQKAQRVAWLLCHGEPVPRGVECCHRCDNPRCVRPDHLFLGTHRENMHDSIRKGRFVTRPSFSGLYCKRGHRLTAENTYRYPDGSSHRNRRTCLECKQARAALAKDGGE